MWVNNLTILVLLFRRVTASPIYASLDDLFNTDGNTDGSTHGSFDIFSTDVSFNTANPPPLDKPVSSGFRPDIISSNEVPNSILASTGSGFNTAIPSSQAWSGTTDVTQGYPVGQSDTIYLAGNSASQDMCYDQNQGEALLMRGGACPPVVKHLKCPAVAAGQKFHIECVDEYDFVFILVGIALAIYQYCVKPSSQC